MRMDIALLLFTLIASFKMIFVIKAITVIVEPQNKTLLEGETLNMMCKVNQSITVCRWDISNSNEFEEIDPGKNLPEGFKYYGRGLEYGDCGIAKPNVGDKENRLFKCKLIYVNRGGASWIKVREVHIVIAKAPTFIQLNLTGIDLDNDKYPPNTFKENKTIRAECKIEFGRPPANISWYIGTEQILDGLDTAEISDLDQIYNGQYRIMQNLTRTLKYLDNGKDLRCVAHHIALGRGSIHHPSIKLNIYFSPKIEDVEQRAFTIGQPGKIVVTIHANPKPKTEWTVGGNKILQGASDANHRFSAFNLTDKGEGTWEAVLYILKVKSKDFEKNFTLLARNILGENETRISISVSYADVTTCPTSFSEVTAWSITGIVSAILLIILIKFIYSTSIQKRSYAVKMAEIACKLYGNEIQHKIETKIKL